MGCLLHLTDINPCAQPPGLTGEECLLREWKCWFNIWATCQMSTKWDGKDSVSLTQHSKRTVTQEQPINMSLVSFVLVPKYSSVIQEHFTPQRMLMRNVNMNWVSANQL